MYIRNLKYYLYNKTTIFMYIFRCSKAFCGTAKTIKDLLNFLACNCNIPQHFWVQRTSKSNISTHTQVIFIIPPKMLKTQLGCLN